MQLLQSQKKSAEFIDSGESIQPHQKQQLPAIPSSLSGKGQGCYASERNFTAPPTAMMKELLFNEFSHAPVLEESKPRRAPGQGTNQRAMMHDLGTVLRCPFPDGGDPLLRSAQYHYLQDPISSPCCGLSFCRRCHPHYLSAVQGSIGWPLKCIELKERCGPGSLPAAYVERESGRCICGHWIQPGELALMLQALW